MLKKLISQIPGENGWSSKGSEEDFYKYAITLMDHGFSETEAVELLTSIYWSVASCYGD